MAASANPDLSLLARAERVMTQCDELAACTEEPGRITRPYGSPSLRNARDTVAKLMRAAGMTVLTDAIGNLRGRIDGPDPDAPALFLGSHLDSVRDAGRYDGPLGVLTALAAVEPLREEQRRLPFPIEVVAFADEEGLRFPAAYLGSRTLAGAFDSALLDLVDANGISLRAAIVTFGGDPDRLAASAVPPGSIRGYVEVHIEQGPYLESVDAPVGIVTAIAGQTRVLITFTGEAGHAGTVAMNLRRDALPPAAELILAVEQMGRTTPGMVATVGRVEVEPGAFNIIPGLVHLTLDLRHPDDAIRVAAVAGLESRAREIAAARSLGVDWRIAQENQAVPCNVALTERLAEAVAASGARVERLPSGAGHDAVVMSALGPVAMLFVRCAGGISHNPAESVDAADVAVAIDVLDDFLDALAAETNP